MTKTCSSADACAWPLTCGPSLIAIAARMSYEGSQDPLSLHKCEEDGKEGRGTLRVISGERREGQREGGAIDILCSRRRDKQFCAFLTGDK